MKKNTENRQKWINVALCALMIFFCLGFCSSNKSLYLKAITDALDIKRSAYSLATSCRFITTSVINIFFGTLVYKFGSKKLILSGFVCLIASVLLNSVATNILTFCIAEMLSGIAFSWSGTAIVGSIINRWCKENTGTITGAVLAANGIGGAVAAQIVMPIISKSDFGYRNAYRLIAILLVIVGVIIAIFFKDKHEEEEKSSQKKKKYRGRAWSGVDFAEAVKKPFFWGAAVCIFLTGMSLHAMGAVSSAHMLDVGIPTALVTTVASISSLALTGTKFMAGIMFDKLGLRKTISLCCLAAIAGMFLLAFVSNSSTGQIFSIIYAICSSVALPLETVMLPLYAGDLFGQKSYNKMMGLFISINVAGYAVGGPFVNFGYEIFGSYKPMLITLGIIMAAVLISLQFVISSSHHIRDKIAAKEAEEN